MLWRRDLKWGRGMRRCGGGLRGRGRRAPPDRWLWSLRLGATLAGRCGGTVSGRGGLDGRLYGEGVVGVLERGLTILMERCGEGEMNLDRTAVRGPGSMVYLEDQMIWSFQLLTLVTRYGVVDRAVWRWARRMKKGKVGKSNMYLLRSCLNVRASRQARCAFS